MTQLLANSLCSAMVLALGAMGFGLVYFTTRHFHVAHGAVYTLGAYVAYWAAVHFRLSLPLVGLIVLAVAAFCGLVLEQFVYAPLVRGKAAGEVVLLSSLGVYVIVANAIAAKAGDENVTLRDAVEQTTTFMGATLTNVQLLQLSIGFLVVVTLSLMLRFSRAGRRFHAVAENPELSLVIGINVTNVRIQVLMVGSVLAGLSGFLAALDTGADPHVGFSAFLNAAICCLFVGARSFLAPAAGAVLLAVLQGLSTWWFGAQWRSAVTFVLLIGVLLLQRKNTALVDRRLVGE